MFDKCVGMREVFGVRHDQILESRMLGTNRARDVHPSGNALLQQLLVNAVLILKDEVIARLGRSLF